MRYIRRKENPLVIKAYGFVEEGGLGEFDPDGYEEVMGDLPEGWQAEAQPVSIIDQLRSVFSSLPVEQQAALGRLASSVLMFVQFGNLEAARLVIQGATVPQELEPVRQQLLAVLNG